MTPFRYIFLLYLLLPLVSFLGLSTRGQVKASAMLSLVVSILRICLLVLMVNLFSGNLSDISLTSQMLPGYPLDISLSLSLPRIGFLLIADGCFIFAYWLVGLYLERLSVSGVFIAITQLIIPVFLVSENTCITGAILILAAPVYYYLIRFSAREDEKIFKETQRIGSIAYMVSFLMGILFIVWGVLEFGNNGFHVGKGQLSSAGSWLWLAMLVIIVPVSIWSRWLFHVVEKLPEPVTVSLVLFISAVTMKIASAYEIAYRELEFTTKITFYSVGILGCIFSIADLFSSKSQRRMLGGLPGFFLSISLVALGLSRGHVESSIYFVTMFVPAFTVLLLYASVMSVDGSLQRVFIALLWAVILGLPGTPTYLIFSNIGSRSIELGTGFIIVFAWLWFLYFCSIVQVCRRTFMEDAKLERGEYLTLSLSSSRFAIYGALMIIFLITVTYYVGSRL